MSPRKKKFTIPGGQASPRFHHIALEVLCRVFPDGADEGFEEWKAFELAGGWLSPERALGGFIVGRLADTDKMRKVYQREADRLRAELRRVRDERDRALRDRKKGTPR